MQFRQKNMFCHDMKSLGESFQPKNVFYRNLHYPIQERLGLLISKHVLHNLAEKLLATLRCLWCALTCLCTVISRNPLKLLFFVIIIDSPLMPPWLVKKAKNKLLKTNENESC